MQRKNKPVSSTLVEVEIAAPKYRGPRWKVEKHFDMDALKRQYQRPDGPPDVPASPTPPAATTAGGSRRKKKRNGRGGGEKGKEGGQGGAAKDETKEGKKDAQAASASSSSSSGNPTGPAASSAASSAPSAQNHPANPTPKPAGPASAQSPEAAASGATRKTRNRGKRWQGEGPQDAKQEGSPPPSAQHQSAAPTPSAATPPSSSANAASDYYYDYQQLAAACPAVYFGTNGACWLPYHPLGFSQNSSPPSAAPHAAPPQSSHEAAMATSLASCGLHVGITLDQAAAAAAAAPGCRSDTTAPSSVRRPSAVSTASLGLVQAGHGATASQPSHASDTEAPLSPSRAADSSPAGSFRSAPHSPGQTGVSPTGPQQGAHQQGVYGDWGAWQEGEEGEYGEHYGTEQEATGYAMHPYYAAGLHMCSVYGLCPQEAAMPPYGNPFRTRYPGPTAPLPTARGQVANAGRMAGGYGLQGTPGGTLKRMVREQVEFYFGLANLGQDLELRALMDQSGWVTLAALGGFSRLRYLVPPDHPNIIRDAIADSPIVELDGTCVCLRRRGDWDKWILPLPSPSPAASPLAAPSPSDAHSQSPEASPLPSPTLPPGPLLLGGAGGGGGGMPHLALHE